MVLQAGNRNLFFTQPHLSLAFPWPHLHILARALLHFPPAQFPLSALLVKINTSACSLAITISVFDCTTIVNLKPLCLFFFSWPNCSPQPCMTSTLALVLHEFPYETQVQELLSNNFGLELVSCTSASYSTPDKGAQLPFHCSAKLHSSVLPHFSLVLSFLVELYHNLSPLLVFYHFWFIQIQSMCSFV